MYHILVCCASGMSTSLLVEKMKRAAEENNIDAEIWAVGSKDVRANAERADVIMLGPQVRYAVDEVTKGIHDKPIEVINMRDYGMMNGEDVLQRSIELINTYHQS